ncbi:MAG: META domain-containing protein [Methanoregula sp.]|nr:META domain-containing protein [Methanoregula sp.]
MKPLTLLLLIVVIGTVMIAGCTSQKPVSPPVVTPIPTTPVVTAIPSTPAMPLTLTRNWIVTTMGIQGGTAITVPTTQLSLAFNQDGTVSGYGGCNNYNGPYALTGQILSKGNGITIGPLVSSLRYCRDYTDQENMYLQILGNAKAYVVDGNQLSITDTSGNVLVYQTPASLVTPAANPQPI